MQMLHEELTESQSHQMRKVFVLSRLWQDQWITTAALYPNTTGDSRYQTGLDEQPD